MDYLKKINYDLLKFYVVQFLRSFLLLNVIITILFDKLNFGSNNAFTFLAVANIFFVILEYPTGIIGDWFGHKVSVMAGHIVMTLGLSVIAFSNILELYYFGMLIYAIGHTLNSGSDLALLKNISSNFAKNLGLFKAITLSSIAIAGLIGPYLFSIYYLIPFYIQISFLILCYFLTFSLSSRTNHTISNVTPKFLIQKSLNYTFSKINNISLLLNSSISWSFLTSLKFITTLYFLIYGLSESNVGLFYTSVLLVDVVTSFF